MSINSKMNEPEKTSISSKPMVLLRNALVYFKLLGSCIFFYGLGYFKLSTSWIIFGCLGYFVYNRALQKRALIIEGLKTIGKNEKQSILGSIAVRELPSWVYFPDIERAEWLNQIIKRMWPHICTYATKTLMETVQPSVDNSLPASLRPFEFTKIDLGDTPPRIGGIKVYDSDNVHRNEIVMDLDLILYSDARIQVQVGKIVAGIKEFELRGTLRVVMKPLVPKIPFAGALTVCFLDNPDINFLLTDMGNILSVPGLQQSLMGAVRDVVSSMMVIPNRIPVQLVSDIELNKIRFPLPHGIIRVNVISGRDLKAADINIVGHNTSDPYCILKVGSQEFKTKVCQKSLNPTWNEYFEAVIDVKDGQRLTFEVWDKDQSNADDSLGTTSISIDDVYEKGFVDSWFNLEGVKRGAIRIRMQWMDLSMDPSNIQQSLNSNISNPAAQEFEQAFGSSFSSAYLFVLVDMAKNISRLKTMSEPSPYASVTLNRESKVTPIKSRTNNPVWESAMHFMVKDPFINELSVTVRDSKADTKLGARKILLKSLLAEPDMCTERPYQLKDTGSNEQSFIYLRLELKALIPGINRLSNDVNMKSSPVDENITVSSELRKRLNASSNPSVVNNENHSPTGKLSIETGSLKKHDHAHDATGHSHLELGQQSPTSSSPSVRPDNCCGSIEMTAHYCEDSNRLGVIVHNCRNLSGVDKDGLSDPYVKLQLVFPNGTRLGEKAKTQVVKNDLNPNFEERFEFNVEKRHVESLSLKLEVKNHTSMFSRNSSNVTFLGECNVRLNSDSIHLGHRCKHWLEPMQKTNVRDENSS